jgi:hypothetical protein
MNNIIKIFKKILFFSFLKREKTEERSPVQKRFDLLSSKILTREKIMSGEVTMDTLKEEIGILYIDPLKIPDNEPIIDDITRKLTWLWHRQEENGIMYFGIHECSCGAHSSSSDHLLPLTTSEKMLTNSLCVHYVAYHRAEISKEEWQKVLEIVQEAKGEEEPNERDLHPPKKEII